MIRKVCREKGHKFRGIAGVPLPMWYCKRLFCSGEIAAPWVEEPLASKLNALAQRNGNQ